jgi:hypothetical protein
MSKRVIHQCNMVLKYNIKDEFGTSIFQDVVTVFVRKVISHVSLKMDSEGSSEALVINCQIKRRHIAKQTVILIFADVRNLLS